MRRRGGGGGEDKRVGGVGGSGVAVVAVGGGGICSCSTRETIMLSMPPPFPFFPPRAEGGRTGEGGGGEKDRVCVSLTSSSPLLRLPILVEGMCTKYHRGRATSSIRRRVSHCCTYLPDPFIYAGNQGASMCQKKLTRSAMFATWMASCTTSFLEESFLSSNCFQF